MKACEFYEKYKGKHFTYNGEKVKVVGYEKDSEFIIVSGYSDGYSYYMDGNSYICEDICDVSDSIYYCSIYGEPFCQFVKSDETEIQPCIESISEPISKRFHAACCAMQGIVNSLMDSDDWHGWSDDYIAKRSFELADELLKQENDGKALQ